MKSDDARPGRAGERCGRAANPVHIRAELRGTAAHRQAEPRHRLIGVDAQQYIDRATDRCGSRRNPSMVGGRIDREKCHALPQRLLNLAAGFGWAGVEAVFCLAAARQRVR